VHINPNYSLTMPKCGNEVVWQNPNVLVAPWSGATQVPYREFGGVIVEVTETTEDGITLDYEISCKSYEHWFNRRLVAAWYNQDSPENILNSIVTKFCPTFTTHNVQTTGLKIVPEYFDYVSPSDAIKQIADQCELGWYIDSYKDVHLYSLETFQTPLPNNTLDVDHDTQHYGDLTLKENSEQQYNRIFLKGFKTRATTPIYLTYTADSQTLQWNTGYRPSSLKGDVAVQVYSSMQDYLNDYGFRHGGSPQYGTTMTVKRDIVDGAPHQQGANNTAYINYGQMLVRIPNFNNGGAVPNGYVVACRFFYLKDTVALAQDHQAQAQTQAIEKTDDGSYEYSVHDKSLTNSTLGAVQAKGQLLLQKYRFPQISGTFISYFNSTNSIGFRAGQYFTLLTTKRFGGINEIMFVQRVNKSIVKNDSGGLITLCEVEFADSQYLV
jgi:hypothetical protein